MVILSAKSRGGFGTIGGRGAVICPERCCVSGKREKLRLGSLKKLTDSDIIV